MGGLITGALLGGGEGFGTGLAKAGELEWKDEHERMKEQAISERSARDIQLKAEADRALETQKGHVVPAGASLKREGQPDFQAPEKPISEEEKAVMRAHANYYNSAARAASAKEPKATLPKIVPLKDEQGNVIAVLDENTGAVGTPTPGSPAKEAISHWFSANEAAKPAVPAGLTWVGPDKQPIAGIHVYYPDMLKRGVGTGTGAIPASQPAARPSLASFMPGAQAAPTQPRATTAPAPDISPAQPAYTPAQISENPRLAQTTPEQRAQRQVQDQAAQTARRQEFDTAAATAKTPRDKMRLFQLYRDVMTPEETKRYASGR